MTKRGFLFVLFVFLLLAVSCSKDAIRNSIVHEWPDCEPSDIILNLRFDEALPLYKEVEVNTKSGTRATTKVNSSLHDLRRIIRVYPVGEDGKVQPFAVSSYVFYEDGIEELDGSYSISLHGGDYHIVVWNDLVRDDSKTDLYYQAASSGSMFLLPDNYAGSTDARDAFRGYLDIHVDEDTYEERSYSYDVSMHRPMAKFQFISTELNEFLEKYDTDIDLSTFNIVFSYTSFLPSEFSLMDDKPVDSMTGMSFSAKLEDLGDGEASLGFDYVFVNGIEASVQVAMNFYDQSGNLLSTVPTIDVPLKRSRLTVVKGHFLTSGAKSGVGVNPDYEGDYNIEIL